MNVIRHSCMAVVAGVTLLTSQPLSAATTLDIAVIGGTGTIGQRIVDEALSRGHRVTVIARDPSRLARSHERLAAVAGDALALAPESIAGMDVVVSAVGTGRTPGADGSIYLKTAQSLIAALRSLGDAAPRLIVVGGVGSLTRPDGTLVLEHVSEDRRPEHRGQQEALEYYRGIDNLRWTYLSPPAGISPGERSGRYRIGGDALLLDAEGRPATISMEDYAVALIDEAENARHIGQRFTVAH